MNYPMSKTLSVITAYPQKQQPSTAAVSRNIISYAG